MNHNVIIIIVIIIASCIILIYHAEVARIGRSLISNYHFKHDERQK